MTGKKLTGLAIAIFALALASCTGYSSYKYANVYSMISPQDSNAKEYGDSKIKVRFWLDEKRINFQMRNLTSEPITIDWAKAEYIHIDGKRHKVANEDTMFTPSRFDPSPTIIKAGDKLSDSIVPAKNVQKLEEWTWYVHPLLNQFNEDAYKSKGKTLGVDMPIFVDGGWKTYNFRFEIVNVAPGPRRL